MSYAIDQMTSLADVKTWMNLTVGTYDTFLTTLIDAVSTFFLEEMNRDRLTSAAFTEVYDGLGGQVLFLRHRPIISITTVTVSGVNIPASNGISAGWILTSKNTVKLIGYCFTRGFGSTTVVYTAGLPAVPPDVQQAAKELVCLRFKERDRIGEQTKHLATQTITFTQKDLLPWMKTALANYIDWAGE